MNSLSSPASLDGGRTNYMRRERFEINQYVRVQVSDTRFAIGVVTAIDEDHDKATVETRNGYEVTLPISALRRAFLVVLDLNGVLVARGRGSFILRPHVVDFLKFVFSNFVVAVWTSGLQRSSNPIIDHVFGSYRDLLLFTLFRDACMPKASPENPYGTEKNLQVIFDRYPLSFHAVNTIIIDDSPDKCSHPDIALCPIPFKDPVAQHQDNGLLETMETLRQVLLLDSGSPLIIAAEERLHKLAEQQQQEQQQQQQQYASQTPPTITTTVRESVVQVDGRTPPSATAAAAGSASPASLEPHTTASHDHDTPSNMEEVELWKTRLCCENLLGKCTRGDHCPFSHDADDGRPCSRKSHCQHHGSRWPKTSEETAQEARKRQIREAKHQQYMQELEKRQHEQQQHLQLHVRGGIGGSRGQPRRQAGALPQHQKQQQQQRGGGRQQQQHQRGDRHADSLDDDWASGPTGLSHTGDPAYDNMINEQQQQQRRHTAQTVKASTVGTAVTAVHSDVYNAAFPTQWQAEHFSNAPSGFTTAAAGGGASGNLSSGYRRQLQHHNVGNGGYALQNTSQGVQGQQGQQQQQQSWGNQWEAEMPVFFQSAPATAPTTTNTIAPFSTRPIAQPTAAPQFSVASIKLISASPPTVAMASNSNNKQNSSYRGDARASPSQQQQQQAIRISGRQGDSNAVVNQLQALMRKS